MMGPIFMCLILFVFAICTWFNHVHAHGFTLNNLEKQMTFTEARDLLVWYNKWRRDNHIPNSYKTPNSTDIGKPLTLPLVH